MRKNNVDGKSRNKLKLSRKRNIKQKKRSHKKRIRKSLRGGARGDEAGRAIMQQRYGEAHELHIINDTQYNMIITDYPETDRIRVGPMSRVFIPMRPDFGYPTLARGDQFIVERANDQGVGMGAFWAQRYTVHPSWQRPGQPDSEMGNIAELAQGQSPTYQGRQVYVHNMFICPYNLTPGFVVLSNSCSAIAGLSDMERQWHVNMVNGHQDTIRQQLLQPPNLAQPFGQLPTPTQPLGAAGTMPFSQPVQPPATTPFGQVNNNGDGGGDNNYPCYGWRPTLSRDGFTRPANIQVCKDKGVDIFSQEDWEDDADLDDIYMLPSKTSCIKRDDLCQLDKWQDPMDRSDLPAPERRGPLRAAASASSAGAAPEAHAWGNS